MTDVTGRLHVRFRGQDIVLHLTTRGLATLQGRHGLDLKGMLTGQIGDVPDLGLCLDLISVALQKGMQMLPGEADDLADDLFTADRDVLRRLMIATLPPDAGGAGGGDAGGPGNGEAPAA